MSITQIKNKEHFNSLVDKYLDSMIALQSDKERVSKEVSMIINLLNTVTEKVFMDLAVPKVMRIVTETGKLILETKLDLTGISINRNYLVESV